MSSASHDDPKTPNRKPSQSSLLLNTFRNLTQRRLTNSTPPLPSAVASTFPRTSGKPSKEQDGAVTADGEISTPIVAGDGPTSQTWRGGPIISEADGSLRQEISGGPPELYQLLDEIDANNSIERRLRAVPRLCEILEQHSISNIHVVWAMASDLLEHDHMQEAVEAAYKLFRSCVRRPVNLSPIARAFLFKILSQDRSDKHLDLRVQALADLLENGKNVEPLEASLASYLCKILKICYDFDFEQHRETRKSKSTRINEGYELRTLFDLVSNVIIHNAGIFREHDVGMLLDQIISMCRMTRQESVIAQAVKLFDKVVTFLQIPTHSIKACAELLCDIYRQLPQVSGSAWRALSGVLRSHNGPFAVFEMLRILREHSPSAAAKTSMARGVLQVLPMIMTARGSTDFPQIPVHDLIPAMSACRSQEIREHEITKLDQDILAILNLLLSDDALVPELLDLDDWSIFVDLIAQCVRQPDLESQRSQPPHIIKTKSENLAADHIGGLDHLQTIRHLRNLYVRMDIFQRECVLQLLLRLTDILDIESLEFLVEQHREERLLHPSNAHWQTASSALLDTIFADHEKPRHVRLSVLDLLIDTHCIVDGVYAESVTSQLAHLMLQNIRHERDVVIAERLARFAVSIAEASDVKALEHILTEFMAVLEQQVSPSDNPASASSHWTPLISSHAPTPTVGSISKIVVEATVRIFLRSLTLSYEKSSMSFAFLLSAARSGTTQSDARISAFKLLFRIRADARSAVFVTASSEAQSIAAVLCRTVETSQHRKEEATDPADDEVLMNGRRETSSPSPHSSLARRSSRPTLQTQSRVNKPTPPLWMYPGPKGLLEEPPSEASDKVFSIRELSPLAKEAGKGSLDVGQLLELAISILQREEDWEVYSYVLVHLGAQLVNHALFQDCALQIQVLRSVVCEQIRGTTFREPPAHTFIKKADVAVCLFHVLTILISFNRHFERNAEDEMVRAFLFGIGHWDRTSRWCIHAITICCHELPNSVSKSLDSIIQKMSQIITQQRVAVDILEFLTALARMPELYKNFRDEDFKMVFGVSWKYLQSVRHQRERPVATTMSPISHAGHGSLRHSGASREFIAPPEKEVVTAEHHGSGTDLPEYVYALAYHVLAFWFMAVKLEDRPRLMDFLKKNLITESGSDTLEEQSQVTIDMMQRVAYSDRDETSPDDDFARASDGEVTKKTWIVGHSIMTIETAARSGASQVVVRRPSSTRYMTIKPHLSRPARHQVPIYTGLAAEAFRTSSYVGILPDDVLQTFFNPLAAASDYRCEEPIPLPDDGNTQRAITIFDRNATVDCHKMGVIYVDRGQTSETDILSNITGSPDYTSFIDGLGTLIRLKDAKLNTAGLDKEFDSDGEYTYCWRDRCTEIIYHIATLMPTDPENPQATIRKKSHIGNDFVTIVFNNSGLPYRFDTIASQFNYINIVITPCARAAAYDPRLEEDPDGINKFYKVQVQVKPGFPDVSPAAEAKVVSGANLAACVRLIALNASFFSLVWAAREGGESISPWRTRLREIKKLRQRQWIIENGNGSRESRGFASPTSAPGTTSGGGGGSSLMGFGGGPRDSGAAFKRSSVAGYGGGENRSSILSGSTDMERQGSDSTR